MPARNGRAEEFRLGPFELLRWCKSLFWEVIAGCLALRGKRFVEPALPPGLSPTAKGFAGVGQKQGGNNVHPNPKLTVPCGAPILTM